MLNWGGFAAKCMEGDMKLGQDLANIGNMAVEFQAKRAQQSAGIMQSISKEAQYKSQAKSFRAAAESATKSAGLAQEAGRQAIESTMRKLGNAKSAIVTGAAGSGIDVTSRTVNKTMDDTVKSAYNEAATQARNEQQTVQSYVDQAASQKINAIWAESNANQEKLNQTAMFDSISRQQKALGKQQIAAGISAGLSWIKTGFEAAGSLMGGG